MTSEDVTPQISSRLVALQQPATGLRMDPWRALEQEGEPSRDRRFDVALRRHRNDKRIGVLLEREGASPRLLRRLEGALSPSTGLIPWIPTRPKRGTIDRRWGVVARTVLLDPIHANALIEAFPTRCLQYAEAMAEKLRAALSLRDVAIRDFFDLDHAVQSARLNPLQPEMLELIRLKLAVPGTEPVDVSPDRLAQLRRQLDAQLRPVLRAREFDAFDLDRAFGTVRRAARALG